MRSYNMTRLGQVLVLVWHVHVLVHRITQYELHACMYEW